MLRMNKRMDNLIEKISDCECTDAVISIEKICRLLCPDFKEIDGTILLSLQEYEIPERIDISKIKQVYGDITGYEFSCNEIRINDYIDYREDQSICILRFALQLQKSWALKIKSEYPEYNFSFILSYDNEYVTLRFHKIRIEEEHYLSLDLNSYTDEAILVIDI